MKGTDLRIGNLIYDFGDGEGQVLAIDKDGYVLTTANDVPQPAETFTGIPLTEEWLIKLGFERIQGWYFYKHSHWIAIELYPDGDFALRINERQVNIYQHVHTVQNIFHSLTGTELTIKP